MLTAKTDDRTQQRTVTVVEMNHALVCVQSSVLKPNLLASVVFFECKVRALTSNGVY